MTSDEERIKAAKELFQAGQKLVGKPLGSLKDELERWKNPTEEMLEATNERVAWRKKVKSKMGNPEEYWKINYTKDQMIGLLREVLTGEDPHSSQRRDDLVDWAYRSAQSVSSPRDDVDKQIGNHLEEWGPFRPIRLSGEEVKG